MSSLPAVRKFFFSPDFSLLPHHPAARILSQRPPRFPLPAARIFPFQKATCTAQRLGSRPSAAMDCCLIPSAEHFPTVKIPPSHRPLCCPAHSQRPATCIPINRLFFFPPDPSSQSLVSPPVHLLFFLESATASSPFQDHVLPAVQPFSHDKQLQFIQSVQPSYIQPTGTFSPLAFSPPAHHTAASCCLCSVQLLCITLASGPHPWDPQSSSLWALFRN